MPINFDLLRSIHLRLLSPLPHIPPNLHPTHENLTHKLQPGHKHTKHTRNNEVADTSPNIQPAPLVPDQPEEVHSQHIANGHDQHEKTARGNTESPVEDAEVGTDDGERDDDFEDQEETLGEGVEDWD